MLLDKLTCFSSYFLFGLYIKVIKNRSTSKTINYIKIVAGLYNGLYLS